MAEKPAPREGVAVEVDPRVWVEEVERFDPRSEAREAAEAEREALEGEGIEREVLMLCEDHGGDGTRLRGRLKAYVPLGGAAPSERPYGFVLSPERRGAELYLELLAFGRRHARANERSVYERAHKRVHGRYQDQE